MKTALRRPAWAPAVAVDSPLEAACAARSRPASRAGRFNLAQTPGDDGPSDIATARVASIVPDAHRLARQRASGSRPRRAAPSTAASSSASAAATPAELALLPPGLPRPRQHRRPDRRSCSARAATSPARCASPAS